MAPGNWYLFLGIGRKWFNKGSQDQINRFYGSKEAVEIAKRLNSLTGNKEPGFTDMVGETNVNKRIDEFNALVGIKRVVNEQKGMDPVEQGTILGENLRLVTGFGGTKPAAKTAGEKPATETAAKKPATETGRQSEATRKEINKQHENAGEIEFVVNGEPQMMLIKQLEQRFPGLMATANTALKSHFSNSSVSFEHMGMHFTVRPELVKGRAVPGAIVVRDPAKLDKATMRELLLTEEQKQVSDQAKDLVTRSE